MFFALVAGAVVGAVANRIRGGFLTDRWPIGGQLQRAIYAALMTAIVVAAGLPWPVNNWRLPAFAGGLLVCWFVGAVAFTTFRSIDAGRVDGRHQTDFFRNGLRGLLYTLPAAVLIAAVSAGCGDMHRVWTAAFLPLSGLFQSVAYEAAWRIRSMEQKPTELGELLTGACFGVGAVAAVMA